MLENYRFQVFQIFNPFHGDFVQSIPPLTQGLLLKAKAE